jgi:ribonuclease Z
MSHTHCFGNPPVSIADPIVLVDDEVIKISAILLQPNISDSCISVTYVFDLPEIMGKFDPKKAAELGLRPGPKYRELQLGNSVMSDRDNIMVNMKSFKRK